MLDQTPYHLERSGTAPEDHRGTELDGLCTALTQHAADILTARKVRRELVHSVTQPSEVNETSDPSRAGGIRKVSRGQKFQLMKVTRGHAERVNEVVGGVDPGERSGERRWIESVAGDDLRRRRDSRDKRCGGIRRPQAFGISRHYAEGPTRGLKRTYEPSPDIAGAAGKQDDTTTVHTLESTSSATMDGSGRSGRRNLVSPNRELQPSRVPGRREGLCGERSLVCPSDEPGILTSMKDPIYRRSAMAVGLVTGVLILVAASFAFMTGCGSTRAPDLPETREDSTMNTELLKVPPIDLLAPSEFQTGSFALG